MVIILNYPTWEQRRRQCNIIHINPRTQFLNSRNIMMHLGWRRGQERQFYYYMNQKDTPKSAFPYNIIYKRTITYMNHIERIIHK